MIEDGLFIRNMIIEFYNKVVCIALFILHYNLFSDHAKVFPNGLSIKYREEVVSYSIFYSSLHSQRCV
jgi:hypothetical protein